MSDIRDTVQLDNTQALRSLDELAQRYQRTARTLGVSIKLRLDTSGVDTALAGLNKKGGKGISVGVNTAELGRLSASIDSLVASMTAAQGRIRTVSRGLGSGAETKAASNAIRTLIQDFKNGEVQANQFASAMRALLKHARELKTQTAPGSSDAKALSSAIGAAQSSLGGLPRGAGTGPEAVNQLKAQVTSLGRAAQGLRAEFQNGATGTDVFLARARALRAEMLQLATAFPRNSQEFSTLQIRARMLSSAIDNLGNKLPKLGIASQFGQALGPTNGLLSTFSSQLTMLPGPLGQVIGLSQSLNSSFESLGPAAAGAATRIAGGFAIIGGTLAVVKATTKSAADYQAALQQVEALSGLSEQATASLGRRFQELSTKLPVSTQDLIEFSRQSQLLGIHGTEGIDTYVTQMAALKVILRDVKGGVAGLELVGAESVKFLRSVGMTSEEVTAQFGTTINTLAGLKTSYGAAIPEIIKLATYWSSYAHEVGISNAEILGTSAALVSVGARAQSAGSSLTRFFQRSSSDLANGGKSAQKWADVMGLSVEQTTRLFKQDPSAFLQRFAERLDAASAAGTDFGQVLVYLGLRGAQMNRTMSELAVASDSLADANKKAVEASEDQALAQRIAAEAADSYNDSVVKLSNSWTNFKANLGESFLPIATSVAESLLGITKNLGDMTAAFNTTVPEGLRTTGSALLVVAGVAGGASLALGGVAKVLVGVRTLFGASGAAAAIGAAGVATAGAAANTAVWVTRVGALTAGFAKLIPYVKVATVGFTAGWFGGMVINNAESAGVKISDHIQLGMLQRASESNPFGWYMRNLLKISQEDAKKTAAALGDSLAQGLSDQSTDKILGKDRSDAAGKLVDNTRQLKTAQNELNAARDAGDANAMRLAQGRVSAAEKERTGLLGTYKAVSNIKDALHGAGVAGEAFDASFMKSVNSADWVRLAESVNDAVGALKQADATPFEQALDKIREKARDMRQEVEKAARAGKLQPGERENLLKKVDRYQGTAIANEAKKVISTGADTVSAAQSKADQARLQTMTDAVARRRAELAREVKAVKDEADKAVKATLANSKAKGLSSGDRQALLAQADTLRKAAAETTGALNEKAAQDVEKLLETQRRAVTDGAARVLDEQARAADGRYQASRTALDRLIGLEEEFPERQLAAIKTHGDDVVAAARDAADRRANADRAGVQNAYEQQLQAAKDGGEQRGQLERQALETRTLGLGAIELARTKAVEDAKTTITEKATALRLSIARRAADRPAEQAQDRVKEVEKAQELNASHEKGLSLERERRAGLTAELAGLQAKLSAASTLKLSEQEQLDLRGRIKDVQHEVTKSERTELELVKAQGAALRDLAQRTAEQRVEDAKTFNGRRAAQTELTAWHKQESVRLDAELARAQEEGQGQEAINGLLSLQRGHQTAITALGKTQLDQTRQLREEQRGLTELLRSARVTLNSVGLDDETKALYELQGAQEDTARTSTALREALLKVGPSGKVAFGDLEDTSKAVSDFVAAIGKEEAAVSKLTSAFDAQRSKVSALKTQLTDLAQRTGNVDLFKTLETRATSQRDVLGERFLGLLGDPTATQQQIQRAGAEFQQAVQAADAARNATLQQQLTVAQREAEAIKKKYATPLAGATGSIATALNAQLTRELQPTLDVISGLEALLQTPLKLDGKTGEAVKALASVLLTAIPDAETIGNALSDGVDAAQQKLQQDARGVKLPLSLTLDPDGALERQAESVGATLGNAAGLALGAAISSAGEQALSVAALLEASAGRIQAMSVPATGARAVPTGASSVPASRDAPVTHTTTNVYLDSVQLDDPEIKRVGKRLTELCQQGTANRKATRSG